MNLVTRVARDGRHRNEHGADCDQRSARAEELWLLARRRLIQVDLLTHDVQAFARSERSAAPNAMRQGQSRSDEMPGATSNSSATSNSAIGRLISLRSDSTSR